MITIYVDLVGFFNFRSQGVSLDGGDCAKTLKMLRESFNFGSPGVSPERENYALQEALGKP